MDYRLNMMYFLDWLFHIQKDINWQVRILLGYFQSFPARNENIRKIWKPKKIIYWALNFPKQHRWEALQSPIRLRTLWIWWARRDFGTVKMQLFCLSCSLNYKVKFMGLIGQTNGHMDHWQSGHVVHVRLCVYLNSRKWLND